MNRAAGWALASRALPFVAGPVTAGVVAATLSPAEQGVYYAAVTLAGWTTWLDLGFGITLQQQVSDAAGRDDVARVGGLLRLGVRYHLLAGAIWLAIAPLGGAWWLGDGVAAWLVLSVLIGLTLPLRAAWPVVEGQGEIAALYRFRTVRGGVSRGALWAALAAGVGVWSLVAERVASAAHGVAWLAGQTGATTQAAWAQRQPVPYRELAALHRGIALSTIGGFMPFALAVPVAYRWVGPVEAGQLGMTMALAAALMSGAWALLVPRIPGLAMAAGRGESEVVWTAWRTGATVTGAAYLLGAGVGLGALVAASDLPLAARLLSPELAGWLLAAYGLRLGHSLLTVHTRSFQQEPLWPIDLGSGLALAVAIFALAPGGLQPVVIGWTAVNGVALVAAALLWRRWHQNLW